MSGGVNSTGANGSTSTYNPTKYMDVDPNTKAPNLESGIRFFQGPNADQVVTPKETSVFSEMGTLDGKEGVSAGEKLAYAMFSDATNPNGIDGVMTLEEKYASNNVALPDRNTFKQTMQGIYDKGIGAKENELAARDQQAQPQQA